MHLYSGTTKSLIEDSTFNRIATKLKDAFFNEFRYQPSASEVNSWNNSLRAISQVFQAASLDDAALEAAVWSNLLTARVCGDHRPSFLYFAMAVQDNGGMLREVSGQLFHPAFRLVAAADEIMLSLVDPTSKSKLKPR